ncbi:MAG TPA: hypothetical protein VNV63_06735 [Nitrospiria bacterium]|nr:hypothetical protein [Nitrospiria bacterium]
MTIYRIEKHVASLLSCPPDLIRFQAAGEPDQAVINAFLAKEKHSRQGRQRDVTLPRYYYLYQPDPRIRLCTVGSTLTGWSGPAWVLIGVNLILGEFHNDDVPGSPFIGNADLRGQQGLQLTMRSVAPFRGFADREFDEPAGFLAELDVSVLEG